MFNRNVKFGLMMMLLANSHLTWAKPTEQIGEQVDKVNHSVGEPKQNFVSGSPSASELLKNKNSNERTLKHQGLQRNAVKLNRQKLATLASSTQPEKTLIASGDNLHHSFSIYTGYSQLITDIDEDGYYQTFSVSFDADILSPIRNEQALVYADLYLSQNGGPWVLYFSTDDFVITGESTDDEFEVVTQLDSGYVPDNYDVLIDLFEVGYTDVVATYSSDDTNTLHALPLESSDYDPEYIEVEYDDHGGGFDWSTLSLLLILVTRRR